MQIITSHNNLDFDGLASIFAAQLLFPAAVAVLPRQLNPNVKAFLSIHKHVFTYRNAQDLDLDEVSGLIVVDTKSWGRLDHLDKLQARPDFPIILWDHHPDSGNIVAQEWVDEVRGATVTLLLRRIKAEGVVLNPVVATLMLAGIYEDTGNLTFAGTTAEDVFAAGYLVEQKGDLHVINTFLRPAYGEKQKNILFAMLQNVERTVLNGYSVSFNAMAITGHVDRLSLVVHMYREIINVDAAFGLFATAGDKLMVIGRSTIDGVNIGSIMRSIGGGGHPGAGSAMLRAVNPDAIIEWIRELVVGNQQSSVRISDLMSFPVISVEAETAMREVGLILDEHGCTGLPVMEEGALVGIISRRDFHRVKKQAQLDAPVRAFMSTTVHTIDPHRSPMQAARLMVKYDIGRLPVVEEEQVIGIITRSDAMTYFYDILPD